MKRLLVCAVLSFGAVALFAGPAAEKAAGPVALQLWTQEGESEGAFQFVQSLAKAYGEANPKVTIEVLNKETEALREDFQTASLAGDPPDLVWSVNDHAGPFVAADLIQPVDGLLDLGKFVDGALAAARLEGKTWGVPISNGNHLMLLYNKTLVPQPPKNTDELVQIATKLTGDGRYGLVWNQLEPFWLVAWLASIYPALRVATIALRPGSRVLSTSLAIIPEDATLENFRNVIVNRDFLVWLWNSVVITFATATVGVALAATSAYAFSRWDFPGRRAGMVFLLTTQMIPAAMMMVPIYILSARLGLIDTWRGLVIAYSVKSVPFSIWILKGYYDTIPHELEQAAEIDGASRMYTFYRIILPLAAPALAIAFLFNFMDAWNDYLLARVLLQRKEMFVWALGLRSMQGQFQTQWGEFSAAALMISAPVMVPFFYSSKWLISGLTLGSVKG